MDINFEYYKIFYYVAKYRNITKAATVLKRNQPNVTRVIKLLESQLNCRLFIREPRGLQLTEEGERLFAHVEVACQHLLCAEEEIQVQDATCRGTVEIGVTETALHLFLLQTLRSFKGEYPDIKIKIQNHSTPEILKSLLSGRVDVALITTPFAKSPNMECKKIMDFEEILVGAKEDLEGEKAEHSLIGLGNGTATYEFYKKVFLRHKKDYELDIEVATSDLILPMIQNHLGIGFVPKPMAEELLQKEILEELPLDMKIPRREIMLVWDKGRGKSRAADIFSKYLLQSEEK